MERSEAAAEARELLGIVFEHAARHGGLYAWLHDTDERLYRTLASLQRGNNAPDSTTLIRALDAAGYKLKAVKK